VHCVAEVSIPDPLGADALFELRFSAQLHYIVLQRVSIPDPLAQMPDVLRPVSALCCDCIVLQRSASCSGTDAMFVLRSAFEPLLQCIVLQTVSLIPLHRCDFVLRSSALCFVHCVAEESTS
jgi:hypothetical protein